MEKDFIRKIAQTSKHPTSILKKRREDLTPADVSDMVMAVFELLKDTQVLIKSGILKGKDGKTPTPNELTALITPLIPSVSDGKTPTRQELQDIIKPLIPTVSNGKTPTKQELLDIMLPLIPKPQKEVIREITKEVISPDYDKVANELETRIIDNLPMYGEKYRDGLELLSGDNRLDKSAIKGLDEIISQLEQKIIASNDSGVGTSRNIINQIINQRIADGSLGGTTSLSAGTGVSITGTGTSEDPFVISSTVIGDPALSYLYTQSEASNTWVITHSLGDLNPLVSVKVDGEIVEPESITINTSNQLTIVFGELVTGTARVLGTGGVSFEDTFETVSKNLKGNPFVLNYTGTQLTSMVYTLPESEEITKTFAYTGSQLDSITLSGDTPSGIDLVKTLGYTDGKLTSVTYS